MDVSVESLKHVYMEYLIVPIVVMYNDKTKEYPGKFLARLFDLDEPTNIVIFADSIEELNEKITKHWPVKYTGEPLFLKRREDDDHCIIGMWT